MARYIDAEKLNSFLVEEDFYTPDERWRPESEFSALIKAMPTADVVEVVRCKDCVNGEIEDPNFPNQYLCHYYGDVWNDGNHFCSYGERKGGGEG